MKAKLTVILITKVTVYVTRSCCDLLRSCETVMAHELHVYNTTTYLLTFFESQFLWANNVLEVLIPCRHVGYDE